MEQNNNANNTEAYYPAVNPNMQLFVLPNQPTNISVDPTTIPSYNPQIPLQPAQHSPQPGQYSPQPAQHSPQPVQYSPQPVQYTPQPVQYSPQPQHNFNAYQGNGTPQQPPMLSPVPVSPPSSPPTYHHPSAPPTEFIAPPTDFINNAQFEITEQKAIEIFTKWRDERWFAPSDFTSLKEGNLYAFLVPYYSFDACVSATYSGKVGFKQTRHVQHHHHNADPKNHNHNHTSTEVTVNWSAGMAYADVDYRLIECGSVVEHDAQLLKSIEKWNLEKVICTPSYQKQLGPSKTWQQCWKKAESTIKSKEHVKASLVLKRQYGADEVENISTIINIKRLDYKLVYLPVYYFGYTYKGKEYKFFINGQNGERIGERPYGLGMFGKGIDAVSGFIGGLFGGKKT